MPKMKTSKTAAKRFKKTGPASCAAAGDPPAPVREEAVDAAPAASPPTPTCTRPTCKKIKRLLGER